jgi:hypothetical protein
LPCNFIQKRGLAPHMSNAASDISRAVVKKWLDDRDTP